MDHDISTNDKWTMDKVLLKPGIVVDIMNRFGEREQELLTKISDLTDELREIRQTHVKLDTTPGMLTLGEPLQIQKSVEDYALAAMAGMLSHGTRYRPRDGRSSNWHEAVSEEAFEIAEAMVAERDKRGIGK